MAKQKVIDEDQLVEDDTKCGLGNWEPNWLQKLASKKAFIIVYGLMGMNEFAFGSYFVGTISSIEKRFKLPSMYSGMITCMWDIGAIVPIIIIAYYGNAYHKTQWVARCSIITAIACCIMMTPHLLFGPGNTNLFTENANRSQLCKEPASLEICSFNTEGMIAFCLMCLGHILFGVGTAAYWTLGAAYLDDNVSKNKFPVYLATSIFLRNMGPTFGYVLSSYTLSTYIDSDVNPPFDNTNPNWIGAWYKGWIPFGISEALIGFFMAFFPKILPREKIRRENDSDRKELNTKTDKPSLKDFTETMWRLVKNPVLVTNTISTAFYIFGLMGYWIFMAKYVETQFRKTASEANIYIGTIGLISSCIGVLTSGVIISKLKPSPRILVGWTLFTETVDVLGHFAFVFLGCYKDDLFGSYNSDGMTWNLTASCNLDCECGPKIQYSPICANGNTTFYSPCHAGCNSYYTSNNTKIFTNCSCIDGFAVDGPCPVDCENDFFIFIGLLCLMKFLSSTGRSGNTVIQYRAVKPQDKAISLAFSSVFFSIFVFIPAPVLYGSLMDSSCLVWETVCGTKGNCRLYHGQNLRYLLNYTSVGFLLLATLVDFALFYYVGPLKIYEDDAKKKETESLIELPKCDEIK